MILKWKQWMLYQNLPLLHIFHLVVERGSFQGAAQHLNLPRSSVSKKVRQLEDIVGQPLLLRSTRQLKITEVGQDLLTRTEHLGDVLSNMGSVIDDTHSSLKGSVKISASVLTGQRFLLPLLKPLREIYPDIQIDLNLEDENVDLIADQVDIAIRIGHLPDSSLIARKVGDKCWGWFASPDYIHQNGMPKDPEDLINHDCLVFSNRGVTMNHWPFKSQQGETHSIEIESIIQTDNSRALLDMACEGLGIVMVDPLFIQQELKEGQLKPVLTDWDHPDTSPIHLMCLGQRSKVSQAVWSFLIENLKFERAYS